MPVFRIIKWESSVGKKKKESRRALLRPSLPRPGRVPAAGDSEPAEATRGAPLAVRPQETDGRAGREAAEGAVTRALMERRVLRVKDQQGEEPVMLIDDRGAEHAAQAICDPHKGNRTLCRLQGARLGRRQEGQERDRSERGDFLARRQPGARPGSGTCGDGREPGSCGTAAPLPGLAPSQAREGPACSGGHVLVLRGEAPTHSWAHERPGTGSRSLSVQKSVLEA